MPRQRERRHVGRVEPQAQPDSASRRIVGLRFAAPDLRPGSSRLRGLAMTTPTAAPSRDDASLVRHAPA
jgi:hypothetical protein